MMGVIIVNGKNNVLLTQRIKTNIWWVIVAATALAVLFGSYASAQSNGGTQVNNANTLKVSPVRTDIRIEKGKTQQVPIRITNMTSAPITVKPSANDFIAGDERGTPALILEDDEYAPTHSLKRFMKPLGNVTIQPKKQATVNVVIAVPKEAESGGYFGALRFSPVNPDGSGEVNLSASVASLMLLTVPGPVTEKLTMTEFNIQQGGKTGTHFQSSNDLQVTTRFTNEGGVQQGPFGVISVKQGENVVYEYKFNEVTPREVILPDSARRWDVPLKNIGSFGYYTVNATFTYGSSNETIEVEKSFWVIPQFVIIGAIVGTIVLILLIIGIILGIRSARRRAQNRVGFGRRR